jgi:hypothetical protein
MNAGSSEFLAAKQRSVPSTQATVTISKLERLTLKVNRVNYIAALVIVHSGIHCGVDQVHVLELNARASTGRRAALHTANVLARDIPSKICKCYICDLEQRTVAVTRVPRERGTLSYTYSHVSDPREGKVLDSGVVYDCVPRIPSQRARSWVSISVDSRVLRACAEDIILTS